MQLTKAMLEQRADPVYDTLVVGGGPPDSPPKSISSAICSQR